MRVYLSPSVKSVLLFLAALTYMNDAVTAVMISPRQFASMLGVLQWHSQLNRPMYSVFFYSYDFSRKEPPDLCVPLPAVVWQELLTFAFLIPYLEADLVRPWLDLWRLGG